MNERYTPKQITIEERQSQQREEAGYYDAEKVVALTIKCDALQAEVDCLRAGLIRILLCSRESASTKKDCGNIAKSALLIGDSDVPA